MSRTSKKAILIALFLGALNPLCGVFPLTSYMNKIFRDSGSTISEDMASIIVAVVQLTANFVAMLVVDRAGRKFLMTISASGTAIGLIGMALFDIFKSHLGEYSWILIVTFSAVIFTASIGMLPLTFVILNEILPKKVSLLIGIEFDTDTIAFYLQIKSTITLVTLEVLFLLAFALISLFPIVSEALGTYCIELMFAICCIIGTIFYLIVLPETKGKTYDEIMMILDK